MREKLGAIGVALHELRRAVEVDMILISVGARGPSADCRDGNAIATVTVGADTETAEAVHLDDAISLARAKCRASAERRRRKTDKSND